ncbi:MAG: DUF1707 SHOCT-like domain-containing protein [Streptosporangiaceae bacterium]
MAYSPAQAFPPQPGVPTGGTAGSVPWMNPAWLAASADRERAVGLIRAGFAEGRLSQDELDDRVGRAYSARTYGELWALTSDLPAGPFVPAHGPIAVVPEKAPRPTSWRPAAALLITALVIFTLAALITAIVTTHAQPYGFQQVSVPAQMVGPPGAPQPMPFHRFRVVGPDGAQQPAVLTPYVISVPNIPAPGGPPPGP